jgi:hypothetical protein
MLYVLYPIVTYSLTLPRISLSQTWMPHRHATQYTTQNDLTKFVLPTILINLASRLLQLQSVQTIARLRDNPGYTVPSYKRFYVRIYVSYYMNKTYGVQSMSQLTLGSRKEGLSSYKLSFVTETCWHKQCQRPCKYCA